MTDEWQPAERVQKNAAGEYRALIDGAWVPVEKAQKNAAGQFRVMAPTAAAAAPAEMPASASDRALGSLPGRIALGASQVITGPLQLGANIGDWVAEKAGLEPTVGKAVNATLATLEEKKQRGMKALGTEGFDWAGLGGSLVGGGAALKAVKPAASILGKIGQGSAVGAGFGAAAPVTDAGDDFFEKKALQTGTGAVIGGAIPATSATVGGVTKFLGEARDLVTKGGAGRIATRKLTEIIGEGNLRPVIDALRNIKPTVPGAKPTAAEALVGVPQGSPVAALQARVAKGEGGASAQFGQRALDQQAAREVADTALDVATKPLRTKALAAANKGGVKAGSVVARINQFANLPTFKPDKVVQGAMNELRETIAANTDANGVINANALYTIRKNIGTTIEKYSKENASWNKNVTAVLVRNIQKQIDREIMKAGGSKDWQKYLDTFAAGKRSIEADVARAEESLKPLQRTLLSGATSEATIPNLLSRPAMLANAALRLMKLNVEPRVDAVLAERLLTPSLLADALEKATPSQLRSVTAEMWKQYGRAATIGAPVTAIAEAEGAE